MDDYIDDPRPSWFRRVFFSIYSYTVIFCLFGICSVSYFACFNASLSTLEKRYQFSSSTGGAIMITDNVATVLTTLFIGFYGKTAHKPRWMSIGALVTGISVALTALPYFIYGPAQSEDLERANITLSKKSSDEMCHLEPIVEDCTEQKAAKMMTMVAVAIFGASNFFRGFGTSIYYTYGTPYLDDNVSKKKMPLFFGIVFSMRILGAPLGYFLSSFSLRYYENPFVTPPNMDEKDPRWIGAWWIGFLVSGIAMTLLSIPLAMFPREFRKKTKSKSKDTQQKLVEASQDTQLVKKEESTLKDMPREIYQIVSNPIIACHLAGSVFRGIGILGHYVFQTKYLEGQFRQSASKASMISGTTGVLSKMIGVQLGGGLITLLKPGPRILTIFIFVVEVTSVFSLLYGASIQGPNPIMPGTAMMNNGLLELKNDCNQACHCRVKSYQPVCDSNLGTAYFSPCHAGCKLTYTTAENTTIFRDCTCLMDTDGQRLITSKQADKCPPDTDNLYLYATIIAVGGMISGSARPGNMVTFFRSVTPEQKSLAVATISFWHSMFVSIPYPLIYGYIFDSNCKVWSKTCNKRGNCWVYDSDRLRIVFHSVSIALVAIGSMFDIVMIFLSPRLKDIYGEQEKQAVNERLMVSGTDENRDNADTTASGRTSAKSTTQGTRRDSSRKGPKESYL
ncbi:Solute carrier organic anion transporter family member 74D [Fragariocoptes setiger]|uniref:Solute carrier organic anion transporter family member n=1 Tax=Fragariocoptes setiger TaxID=1670756 RepID=A0ABQ7S7R5_9ACAR|nr:Solute carrier organic anion transporter family member 74D [Fragariocoptes setiger]